MRTACAIAILTLSLAGCGGGGHERFFPSEPAARDALRQILEQWQRGAASGGIPTDTVRIEPAFFLTRIARPANGLRAFR